MVTKQYKTFKLRNFIFPYIGLIYSLAFLLYVFYLLTFGNELTELSFEGKFVANPAIEKTCILIFYSFLALLPLIFFFVKGRNEINSQLNGIIDGLLSISKKAWKIYLIFFLLFAVFYISLSYFHIPTLDGRVRWFSDRVPPFPYDPPFHTRLSLVLSWFLPVEFVSPAISLFCIFLLYLFLIYANGDRAVWSPILLFCVVFSNAYILKNSYFSNIELPTAVFGFIGLFAIMRKKFSVGVLLLTLSCILKITSLFYAIGGGIFMAYHIVRDHRNLKKVNFSLLLICGIFVAFNLAGLFYYILKMRGGPGYIVQTGGAAFWTSSFINFLKVFVSKYLFLTTLATVGILFFKDVRRYFALISLVLVLLLRCISSLSGGYYDLFFVPLLAFPAFLGILWSTEKGGKLQDSFGKLTIIVLAAASVFQLFFTLEKVNRMNINKCNSNFVGLTRKLSEQLPPNTVVYQRKISLKPYLFRLGRNDLIYFYHSEDKAKVLDNLKNEKGPTLLLHPKGDLGITDEELLSIGLKKSFELSDITNHWRILFKKARDGK